MIILFILGLLLGGVSVIFALQNVAVITVTFFFVAIDGVACTNFNARNSYGNARNTSHCSA